MNWTGELKKGRAPHEKPGLIKESQESMVERVGVNA